MLLSYPIPSPSSSSGANLELVGYIHMVQMTHCQQKTSNFPFFPEISSTVGASGSCDDASQAWWSLFLTQDRKCLFLNTGGNIFFSWALC